MATDVRKDRTFHDGDLVATLMAELSRVGIAQRIATARKQAGLDQHELADLVHVHWRTVQDWESVKKHATPWDRLDELAAITGVSKDWFLHGERGEVVPDAESLARRLDELEAKVAESVALTREALELLQALPLADGEPQAQRRARRR